MIAANYPEYKRHKQIHDRLASKVFTLIKKFHDHDHNITTEVTQFLAEWLSHHIKGEDQKMIQFFQKNS
jgi:hemerythrin